jgi:hypothetical protein
MKYLAWVFLLILFLFPQTIGSSDIDRYELAGNISLIITYPSSNYTILSLVNNNNFTVMVVENIWINFTQNIDPGLVYAVDNYKEPIVPNEINPRSILFTYNNILPALGYGKIFLDLTKTGPTPTPTYHPDETSPLTSTPSPTPTLTPSPTLLNPASPTSTPVPIVTSPSPSVTSTPFFDVNETSINKSLKESERPTTELGEKPHESNLALITLGILIVILLALTVSVLIS